MSTEVKAWYNYEVVSEEAAEGFIYWNEVGAGFNIQHLLEWLHWFVYEFKEIDLHLATPGGDYFEGVMIRYALLKTRQTINTTAVGLVASMGVPIFLTGAKRRGVKGSYLMIHQPHAGSGWGEQAHEKRQAADLLESTARELASMIAEASNKPEVTADWVLENWMKPGEDTYLSMETCLEYGLIHEIVNEEGLNLPATLEVPSTEALSQVQARVKAHFNISNRSNQTMIYRTLKAQLSLPTNATPDEVEAKALEALEEAAKREAQTVVQAYANVGLISEKQVGLYIRAYCSDPAGTAKDLVGLELPKAAGDESPTDTAEAVVQAFVASGAITLAEVPAYVALMQLNPEEGKKALQAKVPRTPLADSLRASEGAKGGAKGVEGKTFTQLSKEDPGYLKNLKATNPDAWQDLYNTEFKK